MIKSIGSFALVLHAHLPYVLSHGRWPHGMDWLNEAAAETYVPLVRMLQGLVRDGYAPHITVGVTPILTEQLADATFREEFVVYLKRRIEAAQQDQVEFNKWHQTALQNTAVFWEDFFQGIQATFEETHQGNLVTGLRQLQEAGQIEIITCAATHGYLPLLGLDVNVQAQIKTAVASYKRHFGRVPHGIWLPECAYRPRYHWMPPNDQTAIEPTLRKGIDEFLSENGLAYFIVDAALVKGGKAIGVYLERFEGLQKLWGNFAKQYQPRAENRERTPRELYLVSSDPERKQPVAVFARDPASGIQVWSGEYGYPGDGEYLDFHKKRFPGGHRYWRVTSSHSDLADKKEYQREKVGARIQAHAAHFVELVKETLRRYYQQTGRRGILCAPYDAELFGHWWFEGIDWLREVLIRFHQDPEVTLSTCGRYLEAAEPVDLITLPEGSWGEGGYHYIWLNEWTGWTWKHIYEDELRLQKLLTAGSDQDHPLLQRILQQAARELLLLESSDWQFLISTWSARDYAELRLVEHHQAFQRLADMAQRCAQMDPLTRADLAYLSDCEKRDSPFPDLELDWFRQLDFPP